MSELHPLFVEILKPYQPFKATLDKILDEREKPAPCGYRPGDCCAMGTGCQSCGDNPEMKEATP